MSVRIATVLVALLLPVTAGAQGAEVPTIAVMDLSVTSLTPGEDVAAVGSSISSMITTELASRPEVKVVDRQRVRELIETQQLAASGRMADEDAVRLGKLLGAHYIVVGSVWVEPGTARLDIRLLDTFTSAVEKAAKRRGDRDRFLDVVTGVVDDFTNGLEARVRVAEAEIEAPAAAVLAYSRGVAYEENGMRDRAAEMYRQALDLFPEHEAARAALSRLGERGGEE